MRPRFLREIHFRVTAAALLILTALAKLVSSTSDSQLMDYLDPLLPGSNHHVLLIAAALEFGAATMILWPGVGRQRYLVLAWLGGNFVLYRLALLFLKPGVPCKCLGTLTEKLHMSNALAGGLLSGIALYLLAGGVWFFAVSPPKPSVRPA